MRVMAFVKTAVRDRTGILDGKSYIAAGDLCTVSDKTLAGLYPVTYPTARESKTRWVASLKGFLCNQNAYGGLSYPAPGYLSATVKSGGCGVCAAVNAVGALTGKSVQVREMRDLAIRCGARVPGGTDMKRLTGQLCKTYGLKCWAFWGTSCAWPIRACTPENTAPPAEGRRCGCRATCC